MKTRAKAMVLTAFLLTLAASTLLRGQDQHGSLPKAQPSADSPFPVVDFKKGAAQSEERRAKGRRYNNGGVAESGAGLTAVSRSTDWSSYLTELPTRDSDAIVVGTVLDAQAHLAPDGNGVYSEFSVKVDEVLKDATANIPAGGVVSVDREGGRVRYPSGEIVTYFIEGQGMPRLNGRYVLFLKRGGENLSIVTAYQIQGGKARPLDHRQKFKKLEGVSEDSLLGQIRSAVTADSHKAAAGR